ncbi:peptide-methionine (S)-S-oxide reductase [Tamlana crocina]|uniref:peptide-methionine (S)-S-oxide reductase n=1 Tax=Tamlana crocina TaxID=393006 RepID=A0ABX1DA57_9FLAO|nr:peptide-methionine (S)-S-oxide reductase [Tamlana crocina]NJX15255.1 peptide methionine sulfoxide reductase [Tamlana crocina]
MDKIALGGGCHWCTEAVFQSLVGVYKVEQGYVASHGDEASWSEAVVVHFKANEITLKTLIEIHLQTHKSTSNHSMRKKYRSAIYTCSKQQTKVSKQILIELQSLFKNQLVTQVLPFESFKPSREQIRDYYYKNPEKPFCENFITPKLRLLLNKYSALVNAEKLNHLTAMGNRG